MINSLTNVPDDELKYHQDNPEFAETVLDRLDGANIALGELESNCDELFSRVVDASAGVSIAWESLSDLFDEYEHDDTLTKERFFKRLNTICGRMQPDIDELGYIELDAMEVF